MPHSGLADSIGALLGTEGFGRRAAGWPGAPAGSALNPILVEGKNAGREGGAAGPGSSSVRGPGRPAELLLCPWYTA